MSLHIILYRDALSILLAMSERSRPEESDDHFSPEKAKTLTLRDTRGELYCLQAYLLAAERYICVVVQVHC
jgi:hypothetical protein